MHTMPDCTHFFAACTPILLCIVAIIHLVLLGFSILAVDARGGKLEILTMATCAVDALVPATVLAFQITPYAV